MVYRSRGLRSIFATGNPVMAAASCGCIADTARLREQDALNGKEECLAPARVFSPRKMAMRFTKSKIDELGLS